MTISDELNTFFSSSKKDDEQKPSKYIMIRFGVPVDDCAFKLINPDISTTKEVLDSLEKIPILITTEELSYKAVGILYEVVEKQKNKISDNVESKSTK